MKKLTKSIIAGLLCILCLSFAPSDLEAQTNRSSSYTVGDFVDSVAGTIYNLAWPTATYRSVALERVSTVAGGYDIQIKLNGLSAFDDSDLWLRLSLQLRDETGSLHIHDLKIVSHNAIISCPFCALKAGADILSQINRQYESNQSVQSTPSTSSDTFARVGSCVTNNTTIPIQFSYRWGTSTEWQQTTVQPGQGFALSWLNDGTAPSLNIWFASEFSPRTGSRSFVLTTSPTNAPTNCIGTTNYTFNLENASIVLYKSN